MFCTEGIPYPFRLQDDYLQCRYNGGKGIRIDLGASPELVADGDYLQPSFAAGLVDGLEDSLVPLLSKAGNTLDSLAVTVAGVNKMLSEENQTNVSRTLAHIEKTMSEVKGVAAAFNGKSEELALLVDNLYVLSSKFNGIADQTEDVMSGVSSVVKTIDESDIEGVISSFRLLLENINDPDGTIGKLFVDNSMYDSIDEVLNDIDSLIRKIEENPKKYIRISIF